MPEKRWLVEVRWIWGGRLGGSFDETERFYVDDLGEVGAQVDHLIGNIATRWAFDCGRVHMPLNPHILSISATPVGERESLPVDEYEQRLQEAVKEREAELRAKERTHA